MKKGSRYQLPSGCHTILRRQLGPIEVLVDRKTHLDTQAVFRQLITWHKKIGA